MLAMGAAGSNTNEGVNVGLTCTSLLTGLGTASGYFWWYGT